MYVQQDRGGLWLCVCVHEALKESPNSLTMRLKVHHRVNLKLERELELYRARRRGCNL